MTFVTAAIMMVITAYAPLMGQQSSKIEIYLCV